MSPLDPSFSISDTDPPDITLLKLDVLIGHLYDRLGTLADQLAAATEPDTQGSLQDYLADLERRLPLDSVRGYILAARHELHGGLTAITKAQGTQALRRPADGDPSTSCPDDSSGQRADRQD